MEEKNKLKALKKELEKCQKEKEEYLAGWQRARADFLNHKKTEVEKSIEMIKYANKELILKLLPILDNFNKAEKEKPENCDNYLEGIFRIKDQIEAILKNENIEEIQSIGEKFNPSIHEAINTIQDINKEDDVIVEELEKGYLMNQKLIRPAKVIVVKNNNN